MPSRNDANVHANGVEERFSEDTWLPQQDTAFVHLSAVSSQHAPGSVIYTFVFTLEGVPYLTQANQPDTLSRNRDVDQTQLDVINLTLIRFL